jgi:hypothetical protein
MTVGVINSKCPGRCTTIIGRKVLDAVPYKVVHMHISVGCHVATDRCTSIDVSMSFGSGAAHSMYRMRCHKA